LLIATIFCPRLFVGAASGSGVKGRQPLARLSALSSREESGKPATALVAKMLLEEFNRKEYAS
jgi:hypothetical protein